jgi:uncharacterized protein (DUF3820 family)
MTDTKQVEIMPFGKYKGMKIVDIFKVDKKYLSWLYTTSTNLRPELNNTLKNLLD